MEWLVRTLCFCGFLILFQNKGCLGCLEEERIGLLELKDSIKGPNSHPFLTWVDDHEGDCCKWERVTCDSNTGQVTRLSLFSAFGVPLLNASLFLPFQELLGLGLSQNSLQGWNKDEGFEKLSKLKKLNFLNLQGNNFNNSVLPSLAEISSLVTIDLGFNQLEESLPGLGLERLAKLKNLEVLKLARNSFKNNILLSLGALKPLKALELPGNFLEGSLSEYSLVFRNLSNLEALDLRINNLDGFSPFAGLENNLKVLDLSQNKFSGRIPSSLLSLNSLEALSLHGNNLSGSISGLCQMKNLQELDLSMNQFEGTLPPCLKNLTSLSMIDLSSNQFEGTVFLTSLVNHKLQWRFLGLSNCNLNISSTSLLKLLYNQYDLRYIDLSNNNIYGNFPNWLVENNTSLETLNLKSNSLSGPIQLSDALQVDLLLLDLSDNLINGELQPNIGDVFSRLIHLNLSKNSLEYRIPSSLGNMTDLQVLDLSSNNFSGLVPESLFENCRELAMLSLSNNRLDGQLSHGLFNLTSLIMLRLSNNQFTGYLPSYEFQYFRPWVLDISENHISGEIPPWIGNITSLRILVMRKNVLTSPIPLQFCNLVDINFFDLSQNQLSGSIPPCLNMSSLVYLHLQENKLTGSIPRALLNSPKLVTLDLKHNNLVDTIPNWFGRLSNLRVVLLKGNQLSGPIPSSFCALNKMTILDLSFKVFSGSIPWCFSNITFGRSTGMSEQPFSGTAMYFGISGIGYEYRHHLQSLGYRSDSIFQDAEQEEVEFMTKSKSRAYKGDILNFLAGVDLSSNHFTSAIL